ncbi:MAG: tetratricopeptide repeat protein [Synechococcaceae cyanobacterium]|jgi:tetratricopeptide (TPR) repeat protein
MPPTLTRRGARLQPVLLALLVTLPALGLGWWLGRQGQLGQPAPDPRRQRLEREVVTLRQQLGGPAASDQERQRLLELLVALNRRAEAIALLEPMADREPDRWSLRLMLAELRRGSNDRAGAERELRQILSRRPAQVEALQLMALLKLEAGQGAAAQAEVKAAYSAATSPTLQAEALDLGLLLAELQHEQGQKAQAQATYLEVARNFPTDQRPLLALALALHDQGNLEAAQEALAQARLRSPDQSQPDPRLDRLAASWGLEKLRAPAKSKTLPAATMPPPGP